MRTLESPARLAINRGWQYAANRFGGVLTYKRFKKMSYDPDTGEKKEFWEEPEVKHVRGQAKQNDIFVSGGVITSDDIWIMIPRDSFTQQDEEEKAPEPSLGDEVIIDDETWLTSIGGRVVWELDPSRSLFTIWLRRA